jgi:hypothetical protein
MRLGAFAMVTSTIVEKRFAVEVLYNGIPKTFKVESHEKVEALLKQAIAEFCITQNAHLLSLYRKDGTEIKDHLSIGEAGIYPDEQLALRPSAVKAG